MFLLLPLKGRSIFFSKISQKFIEKQHYKLMKTKKKGGILMSENHFRDLYKSINDRYYRAAENLYSMSYPRLTKLQEETDNQKSISYFTSINKNDYNLELGFNRNGEIYSKIDNNKFYKRIPISLNILNYEDLIDFENKNLENLNCISFQQRNSSFRNSIDVFINGIKIDPKISFVSIYNGDIDLIIEEKYFDRDLNDFVIFISYNDEDNFKFTFSSVNNESYTLIDFSNGERLSGNFELNENPIKYQIFRNGILLNENEYELVIEDNIFKFLPKYEDFKEDESLEVNYDVNIQEKKETYFDSKYLVISQEVLENFPINLNNLEIYVDGKLLSHNNIKIINPRSYKLFFEEKDYKDKLITFFLKINKGVLENCVQYQDDAVKFMEYIGYKSENYDDLFENEEAKDFFTNKNNQYYPQEYIDLYDVNKRINNDYTLTVHESILQSLKNNPSSFKYFLKKIKDNIVINYNFNYNESVLVNNPRNEMGDLYTGKDFTSLRVPVTFTVRPDYENFIALIYINERKVPLQDIIHYNIFESNFYYILPKYFKEGINEIRIECYKIFNSSPKYFGITINQGNKNNMTVDLKDLGNLRNIRDLDVLVSTDNGYKRLIYEEDYTITFIGNKIKIDFLIDLEIGRDVIAKNTSYTYYKTYVFPDEENFTPDDARSFVLDSYDNDTGKVISNITNYNIMVFLDGILLHEGIDYTISTYYSYSEVETNKIIFKFLPKPESRLEVYFLENDKKKCIATEAINSDYGVFYINGAKIPYDPAYIDIYLNYRKLNDEEIEIISDRIIKIKNSDKIDSFSNLVIYTNFPMHMDELLDYLKYYEVNYSEFEEMILEIYRALDINGNNLKDYSGDIENDISDFVNGYKDYIIWKTNNLDKELTLDDFYAEYGKESLPFSEEQKEKEGVIGEKDRLNSLVDYLLQLIRDHKFPALLDANEWSKRLSDYRFLELMENPRSKVIILDANSKKKAAFYPVLNANKGIYPERIKEIILKLFFKKNILDFNKINKYNYKNLWISKYLYYEDFLKCVTNPPNTEEDWKETEKTKKRLHILNANDGI